MLSAHEEYRLRELISEDRNRLGRKSALDSLGEFMRRAWPIVEPMTPFVPGWHLDAMSEHLEAVFHGQIRNLVINVPPRHCKSTEISVVFPAWCWVKAPELRFITASYANTLAVRDSAKSRIIIESDWYRREFRIDWTLADDQNSKARYRNTRLGERIATSVGGSGTGEGADILIFDDPHNALEASSEAARREVKTYWDQVMSTRGNDPKTFRRIIVMQRLHEDDLCGHVLKDAGYDHLCLPAEYEGKRKATSIGWTDPRKTPGELLWPKRFGQQEVAQLKKDLGSQGWAGQGQQRPAPAEGNIVKDSWWRFYRELPQGLTSHCQSWDLSFDATDNSSFVVGQVWACKGADRYLIHQFRDRVKFTGQLKAVLNMTESHPATDVKLVEKKANGAALIDTLKGKVAGIIAVEPHGSKEARAESVSPQIESGNVYLPHPDVCPWVNDYLHEWKVFPNGMNDDQVDATSQALQRLKKASVGFDINPVSITGRSKWT
jgi:predicted phage terminase large subunit-like protein